MIVNKLKSELFKPYAIIIFIWFLLIAWRAFFLGFFSDDWSLFVDYKLNSTAIAEYINDFPNYPKYLMHLDVHPSILSNRPGYAFFLTLMRFFLKESALGWQILSSILFLVAAITTHTLAKNIFLEIHFFSKYAEKIGVLAAIFFMISPWTIALAVWPTLSLTLFSHLFVTTGLAILIHQKHKSNLKSLFLIFLGMSVYEAYWLLFITNIYTATSSLQMEFSTSHTFSNHKPLRTYSNFYQQIFIAVFMESSTT